eukprot:1296223-Rhodomonas_salina.4
MTMMLILMVSELPLTDPQKRYAHACKDAISAGNYDVTGVDAHAYGAGGWGRVLKEVAAHLSQLAFVPLSVVSDHQSQPLHRKALTNVARTSDTGYTCCQNLKPFRVVHSMSRGTGL